MVVPCSLTCNPTRTLPNQVSNLKGSSMESFILGSSPKIDFSCSAQQHTCNGMRENRSAVLNAQGPLFIGWGFKWATAVICTDAVWTMNLSRPGDQLCDQNFRDFRKKSFLFESRVRTVRHCRSDGRTSPASNFLTKASRVKTRGMAFQTVDLQHTISISVGQVSGQW